MKGSPDQLAHVRHELLTQINHIIGFTEIQIDEAPEIGLGEHVPALSEINTCGRSLMALIENAFGPGANGSDLESLDGHIESEATPALVQAQKLAGHLHAIGFASAADEIELVSTALESLLNISHEMLKT
jgi:signal transduction histidine kinase